MANGDPVFVPSHKSDIRMIDFALAHLVGPIIYLDPPFAAIWSAQVPLITSVHAFCFRRLKTAAHGVEHFLRRRLNMAGTSYGHTDADGDRDNANDPTSEAHCS